MKRFTLENWLGKLTRPDQTRPDQTRPDQTRPDQTRPDQTRPDQYSIRVSQELHDSFRDIVGSTAPIHADDEHAKSLGLPKAISYGLLMPILSVPLVEEEILGTTGLGLEWNIVFHKSIFVGDTLNYFCRITNVRKSIKVATTEITVKNQYYEVVAKIIQKSKLLGD
jgi:acyl dehydratase